MLSPEEVEHTLGLLFQVTFEAAVDLARPARFIIKRPFFLVICLALLSLLATKPEWKKRVAAHCVYMIEAIQNSYWNYTICARVTLLVVSPPNREEYSDRS